MSVTRLDGITGKTPAGRLRQLRRRAGIKNAAEAARKLQMSSATYYQHESGHNAVTAKQAEAYGEFYGVPAAVILYGNDAVIFPEEPVRRTRIIGRVNDRGLIQTLPQRKAGHWLANVELVSAAVLEAVVIDTDALAPLYCRGDHVFFHPLVQPLIPEEVDGREAVLSVDHGRKMLATLHRAGEDGWAIHVAHRPPIRNRLVFLASPVRWVKRAV